MLCAPVKHLVYYRDERQAEFSDPVFGARWKFGIDGFFHKTIFHHLLQLDVEHSGSGFRKASVDFTWPLRLTATQLIKNA